MDVLNGLMNQRAEELRASADPGTTMRGDRRRIREALTNLVSNAVQASERGSTVSIDLGADDDHASLEVRDEGRGIPAHLLPRVGTAFFNANLRVSFTFPLWNRLTLEPVVEAFNLTDHRNVVTRNTNFGAGTFPTSPSPTFGQITSVAEPRSLQVGVRMRF